jgi:hypothetical protein
MNWIEREKIKMRSPKLQRDRDLFAILFLKTTNPEL